MQAIQTKYISPSAVRGARIKATCARGSITVDYPHELPRDARHAFAAQALVDKFAKEDQKCGDAKSSWGGPRVEGELPDGTCAHVFCDPNELPDTLGIVVSTLEKLNNETNHPMKAHVAHVIANAKTELKKYAKSKL